MTKEEIIKLWKELNVVEVKLEFSCGGDSMNDTQLHICTKEKEIKNSEIEDYFDREVYKNVDFYVNSDGHYQGESGIVHITLDEDELDFQYDKIAKSEFIETLEEIVDFELNENEIEFINSFIHSFSTFQYGIVDWNYKKDFILTDEMLELMELLNERLMKFLTYYIFKNDLDLDLSEDDPNIIVNNPIKIEGNIIKLTVSTTGIKYEDSY